MNMIQSATISCKTISIGKRNIVKNLFVLFFFTLVFFPNDKYNFKLISFLLLMSVFFISQKGKIRVNASVKRILYSSIGLTVLLTFISVLSTKNIYLSFSGAYYWLFLLSILPALAHKIDIVDLAIKILKLLLIVIAISMMLDFVHIISIEFNPLLQFLQDEFVLIVKSPQYYTYYKITHKANPLFIILFCYSLEKHDYKWIVATLIIVFISYSEVVVAALLLSASILFLERHFKGKKKVLYMILVVGLCVLLTFVMPFYRNTGDMIVRQSIITEITRLYSAKPEKILLGYGDKALIYVAGRASYEEAIEISYIEGIRRYGVIGMIPMLYIIIYPIVKNYSKNIRWFFAAILSYFVIASVNLFLFSSTAMFIYSISYMLAFESLNMKEEVS